MGDAGHFRQGDSHFLIPDFLFLISHFFRLPSLLNSAFYISRRFQLSEYLTALPDPFTVSRLLKNSRISFASNMGVSIAAK